MTSSKRGFHYNTRSASFPQDFPAVTEGTTVDVAGAGGTILSCVLAKGD